MIHHNCWPWNGTQRAKEADLEYPPAMSDWTATPHLDPVDGSLERDLKFLIPLT